jgi:hypothetical protein
MLRLISFSLLALALVVIACSTETSGEVGAKNGDGGIDGGDSDSDSDTDTVTDTNTESDAGPISGNPCAEDSPFECDPITGEPCNGAEVSCDFDLGTHEFIGFYCFGDSTEPEGAECDQISGPWCAITMSCYEGACRKYCCSDDDCAGEPCTPMIDYDYWEGLVTGDELGFCLGGDDPDGGPDSGPDGGDDGGADGGDDGGMDAS